VKLLRYLGPEGKIHFGRQRSDTEIERISGDPYTGLTSTGETAQAHKLRAPVEPVALLYIGLNCKHHAAESGMQAPERSILFVKGPNALQHPGEPIEIPTHLASTELDYECELAVVIGKPCKNVSREKALEYVLGYTCERRQLTRLANQAWGRAMMPRKFLRHLCSARTRIGDTRRILNPNALAIKTIHNGGPCRIGKAML